MIEGGELSVAQAVAAGETCLEAVCRIAYLMCNKVVVVDGCCCDELLFDRYTLLTADVNKCRPMVVASCELMQVNRAGDTNSY